MGDEEGVELTFAADVQEAETPAPRSPARGGGALAFWRLLADAVQAPRFFPLCLLVGIGRVFRDVPLNL